jgi:hypothetical protein
MASFRFTGKYNLSLNFQLNLKHVVPLIYVSIEGKNASASFPTSPNMRFWRGISKLISFFLQEEWK